jgi:hypothetical protein
MGGVCVVRKRLRNAVYDSENNRYSKYRRLVDKWLDEGRTLRWILTELKSRYPGFDAFGLTTLSKYAKYRKGYQNKRKAIKNAKWNAVINKELREKWAKWNMECFFAPILRLIAQKAKIEEPIKAIRKTDEQIREEQLALRARFNTPQLDEEHKHVNKKFEQAINAARQAAIPAIQQVELMDKGRGYAGRWKIQYNRLKRKFESKNAELRALKALRVRTIEQIDEMRKLTNECNKIGIALRTHEQTKPTKPDYEYHEDVLDTVFIV